MLLEKYAKTSCTNLYKIYYIGRSFYYICEIVHEVFAMKENPEWEIAFPIL